MDDIAQGDRLPEALGPALRLLPLCFRQNDHKLLAAEPPQNIHAAQACPAGFGDCVKHKVPGAMAVLVVDMLEVIEIEQNHAQRPPVAPRPCHLGVEAMVQPPPAQRAGQAVGGGELAQFDAIHGHAGQVRKRCHLRARGAAWPGVDGAQRADAVAVAHAQRHAGVETDKGRAHNQRIVSKTQIEPGIRDHERFIGPDRMAAQRALARGFAQGQPDAGFEPLPVRIDQRDQRDRRGHDLRRHACDPVERLLLRRVEQMGAIKCRKPQRLVGQHQHVGRSLSDRPMLPQKHEEPVNGRDHPDASLPSSRTWLRKPL